MIAAARPTATDTLTPNRTMERPYPAVTSTLSRTGSGIERHPRNSPQVNLLDALVGLDVRDGPFRQHLAGMHDGHEVGVATHELHVVLDHSDDAVADDALQQLACLFAFFAAHARDRLVEKHHLRV